MGEEDWWFTGATTVWMRGERRRMRGERRTMNGMGEEMKGFGWLIEEEGCLEGMNGGRVGGEGWGWRNDVLREWGNRDGWGELENEQALFCLSGNGPPPGTGVDLSHWSNTHLSLSRSLSLIASGYEIMNRFFYTKSRNCRGFYLNDWRIGQLCLSEKQSKWAHWALWKELSEFNWESRRVVRTGVRLINLSLHILYIMEERPFHM